MYREFQFFDTISNISTYSRERAKIVDLFPRTDNTYKNHTRPIPAKAENEKYIPDIKMMLSFHVETVVLITRYNRQVYA